MAETLPVPQSSPSALDVGMLVGDTYELVRVIGRGGMGEVWAARHRRLPGKLVAVKVLHTGGRELTQDALARFRREAEIASRIGHPNIVQVIDFNTLPSGAPFLVLELLQGESLASKLRFGALAVDEAVSIARQTGSALKAAHAQGIVHRDLKPDNIFLVATPMGTMVKVLDFGISKVRDSQTVQTQEAVLLGTPQYMSPEQAIGANKDVGPQSDVFALGAITYEMLTGLPPFQAESVAKVVFQIAYQPHTPLAERRADLPPRVVQAVEKALLKDRAHRWDDIGAFVAELSGRPLEDSGVMAVPQPAVGTGGVATPSMQTPGALDQTAMSPASPKPPDAAVVVDTKSKSSSSSSSGSRAMVYAPASSSSSTASRKWVAYVLAAGLMVGVGGTAILAQQVGGRPMAAPDALDRPVALSRADEGARPAAKTLGGVPRDFPKDPSPTQPPPPPVQVATSGTLPQEPGAEARPSAHPKLIDGAQAVPAKASPPFPGARLYAKNEELVQLEAVAAMDPKTLLAEERSLSRQEMSPRAKEYLKALVVKALCTQRDQIAAPARFRALKDARLKEALIDYCGEYNIGPDMLK